MKVGDLIKVIAVHWSRGGEAGILIEDVFPSSDNKGKAWRILFSDGRIKTKLAKHLEVVDEN